MKKVYFLLALAGLVFASCENQDVLNQSGDKTINEENANANPHDYVKSNANFFGDEILIFESYEEMEIVLCGMSEQTYSDLRQWTMDNNFINPVLESMIVFDSLFNSTTIEVENTNQIQKIAQNKEAEEIRFQKAISNPMYSNYISQTKVSGSTETYIEPLGGDDFYAPLYNKKNIYIIDSIVTKKISDGILYVNIFDYKYFVDANTVADANSIVNRETTELKHKISIEDNNELPITRAYNSDEENYETSDGEFKLKLRLKIKDGNTGRTSSIWMRNYKKMWVGYVLSRSHTCFSIQFQTQSLHMDLHNPCKYSYSFRDTDVFYSSIKRSNTCRAPQPALGNTPIIGKKYGSVWNWRKLAINF